MELMDRVSVYCIEHHITKSEFAKELGMSYSALWTKLRGKRRFTLNEAYSLSKKIDISISELIAMLS